MNKLTISSLSCGSIASLLGLKLVFKTGSTRHFADLLVFQVSSNLVFNVPPYLVYSDYVTH